MASINRIEIMGYLGKDADAKSFPNGGKLANFTVATDESYKDKNGQKVDKTEWHRCVAWGGWADAMVKYGRKGVQVFVVGRLQTRSWEKDGQKHYSTEINVEQVTILNLAKVSSMAAQPAGESSPAASPSSPGLHPEDALPF